MRFWDMRPKMLEQPRTPKQVQILALNYTRPRRTSPQPSANRAAIIYAQCGPILQVPSAGYPELAAHVLALARVLQTQLISDSGPLRGRDIVRLFSRPELSVLIEPNIYLLNQFGRLDRLQ